MGMNTIVPVPLVALLSSIVMSGCSIYQPDSPGGSADAQAISDAQTVDAGVVPDAPVDAAPIAGFAWTLEQPQVDQPGAQYGFLVAWDDRLGCIVALCQADCDFETAQWDGSQWDSLTTTHAPPLAGSLVGDSNPQVFQLTSVPAGGADELIAVTGDTTWVFNGIDWRALAVGATPTALDNTSQILLGNDQIGGNVIAVSTDGTVTRTWSWDDTADQWTQLSPAHEPVFGTQLVFDDAIGGLVMFDLYDMAHFWVWQQGDWSVRTMTNGAPPPREYASVAYDPRLSQLVLVGGWTGQNNTDDTYGYFDDSWGWDGTSWQHLDVTAPTAGFGPLAFDAVNNVVDYFQQTFNFNDALQEPEYVATSVYELLVPANQVRL